MNPIGIVVLVQGYSIIICDISLKLAFAHAAIMQNSWPQSPTIWNGFSALQIPAGVPVVVRERVNRVQTFVRATFVACQVSTQGIDVVVLGLHGNTSTDVVPSCRVTLAVHGYAHPQGDMEVVVPTRMVVFPTVAAPRQLRRGYHTVIDVLDFTSAFAIFPTRCTEDPWMNPRCNFGSGNPDLSVFQRDGWSCDLVALVEHHQSVPCDAAPRDFPTRNAFVHCVRGDILVAMHFRHEQTRSGFYIDLAPDECEAIIRRRHPFSPVVAAVLQFEYGEMTQLVSYQYEDVMTWLGEHVMPLRMSDDVRRRLLDYNQVWERIAVRQGLLEVVEDPILVEREHRVGGGVMTQAPNRQAANDAILLWLRMLKEYCNRLLNRRFVVPRGMRACRSTMNLVCSTSAARVCTYCGAMPLGHGALRRCGGCYRTYYCSVACQRIHRPLHRICCQMIPRPFDID